MPHNKFRTALNVLQELFIEGDEELSEEEEIAKEKLVGICKEYIELYERE